MKLWVSLLWLSILLPIGLVHAGAEEYRNLMLSYGPSVYFPIESNDGVVSGDISGNNLELLFLNGTTLITPGVFQGSAAGYLYGGHAKMRARENYVFEVELLKIDTSSPWTYALFFKIQNQAVIMGRVQVTFTPTQQFVFGFLAHVDDTGLAVYVYNPTGPEWKKHLVAEPSSFDRTQWNHVVFAYEGASGIMAAYLNGVQMLNEQVVRELGLL